MSGRVVFLIGPWEGSAISHKAKNARVRNIQVELQKSREQTEAKLHELEELVKLLKASSHPGEVI